jgi:hypothetical protein
MVRATRCLYIKRPLAEEKIKVKVHVGVLRLVTRLAWTNLRWRSMIEASDIAAWQFGDAKDDGAGKTGAGRGSGGVGRVSRASR